MRILFINPYFKPYLGGIERVIEKLAKEFLQSGKVEKVGVLTTKWSFPRNHNPDWKDYEIIDGVEVFRISSWPHRAPPFSQVPLVWFSPLEIKKVIKKFQPDVIQLMSDKWVWGNFWAWVFSRNKVKIIYSLSFHQLTFKQQWLRPFNFFLTRIVDKVQVITNYEKNLVKKTYFTPEEKFVVVKWGISTTERTSQPVNQSTSQPVTILCVGRLSKHKGQMWLLERYAEIVEGLIKPTKLILVGADEGEEENLELRIKNLELRKNHQSSITNHQLPSNVKIIGEVSDDELEQWYQKADIFALFPEYEAFGLVFLEAMSYGVPVLTHKVGAVEEVLNGAAMLIEPYNSVQAKVALTKLIEDDKFRQQLGQKGYEYVKQKFSWQKTAESFLNLYNSRIILGLS